MTIIEGQLRWVQMYSSIGDTPPYHLSWDGKRTVCGVGLYDGGETNRYEQELGAYVPEPHCGDCQKAIAANLGLVS